MSAFEPQRTLRLGLSLIEMVISLSMLTVILGASVSMVLISSRAMSNNTSNVGSDAVAARAAADQVLDDLKMATAITEQSARAVTMTVPDRDGDGAAETIRYAWSGTSGDPLTRQYNSRPAATVAGNVTSLSLTYLAKTAGKPPPVEGPSKTHHLHAAAANLVTTDLSSSKGVALYVKPTIDTKAVSWKVTKLELQMERDAVSTGTVTVSVKYADASKKPSGAVLQTGTVGIVDLLGTSNWTAVTFAAPADLDPTKTICLTVTASVLLGNGGRVRYDSANTDSTTAMLLSSDGGATWGAASTTSAVQARVTGTVTTQEEETLDFQPLPASP